MYIRSDVVKQILSDPAGVVALFAMLVILIIELYALSQGVNGVALSAALTGVGAIGGFVARGIQARQGGKPRQ